MVRGPDLLWGGDVREFHPPWGSFRGVIGGPPCQNFSRALRSKPDGNGELMLAEFARVVGEAEPDWWVMENVPGVPDLRISGYKVQRFNLNAAECGGHQRRLRAFHFGSRDGTVLVPDRTVTPDALEPTCMASERGRHNRRGLADFCELQGLPRDFDLPGLSLTAKYRAVGNGVPVHMARVIARAVQGRGESHRLRLCACHCGREIFGNQITATAACRKRIQRARQCDTAVSADARTVTV